MSSKTKKTITEQEAAAHFVLYSIKEAENAWPSIYKSLKEFFKEKFVVVDEKTAAFDLALAAIAQDLQAVHNLFPKDQAERIKKWVFECINTEDWGEYATDEVKKYCERFQKDLQNNKVPVGAIPARLLQRWLGKNIQNFDVEINGKKTGIIDPILIDMLTGFLMSFVGIWKRIKDDSELTEGDLPLNYAAYSPASAGVKTSPDKGNGKKYRVLIKGPWEDVKEDLWELSEETLKKFGDEENVVRVVCVYEKGGPKYNFVAKRMWEEWDKISQVISTPNLSSEQQIEEVKRIMLGKGTEDHQQKTVLFSDDEATKVREIIKPFLERGVSENPPNLVIFMGGVGVGKTTIRKQKYAEGYVHFEFGEILTATKKIVGENNPKLTSYATLASNLILKESLSSRKNIVTEVIGDNDKLFTPVIDKMIEIGYKISVQGITADIGESRKRHLKAVEEDKDYISVYFTQGATLSEFYQQLGLGDISTNS